MRRAFTLIELLVIVAIISVMTTVGILSITAGQGAARTRGAARDVFAAIRHARSVALVTQQPAIITYSTEHDEGEVIARVEVTSAKLFDAEVDRSRIVTFTGEPIREEPVEEEPPAPAAAGRNAGRAGAETAAAEPSEAVKEGETRDEILFSPIDDSVVRGMRVKVLRGEEELEYAATPVRKSRISVFSNVDYLLGRYKESKAEKDREKQQEAAKTEAPAVPAGEEQEPVSIVWETNGRVEPHRVWVYADGQRPEDGLCICVDAFGGAKVVSGDGKED